MSFSSRFGRGSTTRTRETHLTHDGTRLSVFAASKGMPKDVPGCDYSRTEGSTTSIEDRSMLCPRAHEQQTPTSASSIGSASPKYKTRLVTRGDRAREPDGVTSEISITDLRTVSSNRAKLSLINSVAHCSKLLPKLRERNTVINWR